VTYDVAAATCASMGMQLIRVDSAAENDWLASEANDSWIGASDVTVEGEWRWTDGTLFWLGGINGAAQDGLFSAWGALSPSGSPPAADCARIEGNDSTWIHVFCSLSLPFVCEEP
jgi:hypothetical protein